MTTPRGFMSCGCSRDSLLFACRRKIAKMMLIDFTGSIVANNVFHVGGFIGGL